MNKIYLVEGCQGAGKTTVTNLLREKMPYTQLIRASGIENCEKEAKEKVYEIRKAELAYMNSCKHCNTNFIMDRFFLSEQVYCELGYKDYKFNDCFSKLCCSLDDLTHNYDIQLIMLNSKPQELQKRLQRDKATYANVTYDIVKSMSQQKEYQKWALKMINKMPYLNLQVYDSTLLPADKIVDMILRD